VAGKTNTEKINDLEITVAILSSQVTNVQAQLDGIGGEQGKAADSLADFKTQVVLLHQHVSELKAWRESFGSITDMKTEVALLKRESDELKGWKDDIKRKEEERGRKIWMLVPPILAAILSSGLTAILTYLLR
jgi:hypothetical protein